MKCTKCGTEFETKFCPNCGTSMEDMIAGSEDSEELAEQESQNLEAENKELAQDSPETGTNVATEETKSNLKVAETSTEAKNNNEDTKEESRSNDAYSYGETSKEVRPKEKWYKKTWAVILLLIIFWPVGLFLMWKYKKNWKMPVKIVITAILALFTLIGIFNKPDYTSMTVTYEGETKEGTVLDKNNSGFVVIGKTDEGTEGTISGWNIENPQTLEKDSIATVTVTYKKMSTEVPIQCSTSELISISASYDGNTEAGTVIDGNNAGVHLKEIYKNGMEEDVPQDKLKEAITTPITLEADGTANIEISYKDLSTTLTVECSTVSVVSISASYDGGTEEGAVINQNNENIHVTAKYKNGEEEEVTDWTAEGSVTLKAGKSGKIKITYENQSCELKVECSTMTAKQYKNKCKSISYKKLARDPDIHKGKNVKFTGEVVQVLEDSGYAAIRINVTNKGYGYYDDTVYVMYKYGDGESKILEDDMVSFYGEYVGLYSYESVMGAEITIPEVNAKYIDVK